MRRRILPLLACLLAALALTPVGLPLVSSPAGAQTTEGPSGLPLPRFVSVRSSPVNVRVGPGTRYDIAFVFVRPGVPVEITQEFDTWRRIRDVDGDEGWLHQSLLAGTRTALVAPWTADSTIALRRGAGPDEPTRAWLSPGMMVEVRSCDSTACSVRLNHTDPDGRTASYDGFVDQDALWGVYPDEIFD
ncbi:SH3 domain-containing protein [Pelagibacterium montanilacus]|uniref:SH3 domain-containing protein n=1 Tax=Pelagibacterium montanilacus TaxID=2185280 RepID=UPI001FE5F3A8|nr:SH3 domain-containing protein [Pelagibacterium montanilacus]